MRGMACLRIGQFGLTGSIKLAKYGVTAKANLPLECLIPSISSGVKSITSFNCSKVVIRCRSCHLQSFHSFSETPLQYGGMVSFVSSILFWSPETGNNKSCEAFSVPFKGTSKLESEAGSI